LCALNTSSRVDEVELIENKSGLEWLHLRNEITGWRGFIAEGGTSQTTSTAYAQAASMGAFGRLLDRLFLAESGPQRRIERDLKKIGGR